MSVFQFSTECFSGDCGFCKSCNNSPSYLMIDDSGDSGDRASDFKKFFEKEVIQANYDKYLSSLNKSLKKYHYLDKKEQGFTPKKITTNSTNYKLVNTSRKCDSLTCQLFYLHQHDTINDKLIRSTPIYKSNTDKYFCILCVTR